MCALVVDDDSGARAVVGHELRTAGFAVIEACDGEDAWQRFQCERVDLVVTDLVMPRADGLELIRRIRTDARSWVPVIVVTSQRSEAVLPSVFEAGQGAATHFLHLRRDLERLGRVARSTFELDVHSLREQRRNLHHHELRRMLIEEGGNISRMAERIGADRNTVYYHLKKYRLYRPAPADEREDDASDGG